MRLARNKSALRGMKTLTRLGCLGIGNGNGIGLKAALVNQMHL